MFSKKLDSILIAEILQRAHQSSRRRANHCFHSPSDRLQRMVNVALKGSYFAPHQHKNPDKLEIFTILSGRVIVITFNDQGEITDKVFLSREPENGNTAAKEKTAFQVEIPPGVWHTLVVLSEEAVLYEIIDGHYHPDTHKKFAPWAPLESDSEAAQEYLEKLISL